ncbi:MAG: hypothetical protein ABEJ24_01220 [Candidatus Magasanikbacteria bacterium]
MTNCIYKTKLPNQKYGHLIPPEDSVMIDKDNEVFCVADGVTRDVGGTITDDKKDILIDYPNLSGARLAADTFTCTFVDYLQTNNSLQALKTAFCKGNDKIRELNRQREIDYIENDYYSCVASGGIVLDQTLYWGAICDCGVAVFSESSELKFKTPDYKKAFDEYEENEIKSSDFNWSMPEYRKIIRSEYRNNTEYKKSKEYESFGVLTGEQEAEEFMHFGKVNLGKNDLVLFYSDGFLDYFSRSDFFEVINQDSASKIEQSLIPYSMKLAKKNYKKYGKERSIIVIKV